MTGSGGAELPAVCPLDPLGPATDGLAMGETSLAAVSLRVERTLPVRGRSLDASIASLLTLRDAFRGTVASFIFPILGGCRS